MGVFLQVLCEFGGADVLIVNLKSLDELRVGIKRAVRVLFGDGSQLGDGDFFVGVGLREAANEFLGGGPGADAAIGLDRRSFHRINLGRVNKN